MDEILFATSTMFKPPSPMGWTTDVRAIHSRFFPQTKGKIILFILAIVIFGRSKIVAWYQKSDSPKVFIMSALPLKDC
jgi:hypothetical protein